jgi:hypothetical protein
MNTLIVLWFVGFAAFAIGTALYQMSRRAKSKKWNPVQGTVESTDIRVAPGGRGGPDFYSVVAYSYEYEGEMYGATQEWHWKHERQAESWLRMFAKGTVVTVRCNPTDPSDSYLREDDNDPVMKAGAAAEESKS